MSTAIHIRPGNVEPDRVEDQLFLSTMAVARRLKFVEMYHKDATAFIQ
jgi:hypothetical protein